MSEKVFVNAEIAAAVAKENARLARNGGDAFPRDADWYGGLTKREYMAAATLAGIMPWALSVNMSAEGIAHHAVKVADALLAELAK